MSQTRRFVEQRIQKNRLEEARQNDLKKMLVTHHIIAGHGRSDYRVEALRRSRSEAAERRDLFTDYSYVKNEQEKERRTMIAEAEERLADELARRNAEQTRKEMDKKRICDGSEELRVLKEKLHAAKVNKQRAQQMLEIEVRKDRDRKVDLKIDELCENERLEHLELEHKLEIEKMKQRERVKQINQQQIATKEAMREEAMQEYLKEKKQVQDLVERIAIEDVAEQRAKSQKQQEHREIMLRFKVEQEERHRQMEEAEAEEIRRIEKFAADKAEREERLAEKLAEEAREKERIYLGIMAVHEEKNKAADELEQLRNDLHAEEHEAAMRRREDDARRKKHEDIEEMKRAYADQMQQVARKREIAAQEEERIREVLLAKFAEDDRIEQMNEQKRRMRVETHKREAQRLLELRRQAFEQARAQERGSMNYLKDEDAHRQAIIEEERRRLLKEFAGPLRDFLPKGTFETKEDYLMVFPEAVNDMEMFRAVPAAA